MGLPTARRACSARSGWFELPRQLAHELDAGGHRLVDEVEAVCVQRRIGVPARRTESQKEEASWNFVQVIGEVLAAHRGARQRKHPLIPQTLPGNRQDVLRHCRVVDRRRITRLPAKLQLAPGPLGDAARLWLGAGLTRRARIAEAGKLSDSTEPPYTETTTAATGVIGVRWSRRGEVAPRVTPSSALAALPGGFVRADLAIVAWNAQDALFPTYSLFGREVLEGIAVTADVEGAAAVARAEWAPLRGVEVGGAGYAAARQVPTGVASGVPDYRAVLWAGPRFALFRSSVEVLVRIEADRLGPRPTTSGSLPPLWRLGGRASVGFGDAWLVLRAVDLAGAEAPLPGDGPDNVPLVSPGTQWRLYGEWRLLD